MNRKLFGGMAVLLVVAVLAVMSQISANPFWSPPPPPEPTQTVEPTQSTSANLENVLDLSNIPLPTQTPSSVREKNEIEQLQQPPAQANSEYFRIPSREGRTPGDWTRYEDPNFNFAFSYPANWLILSPEGLRTTKIPSHGYLITIQNFENVVSKIGMKPNELKVDLWLFPKTDTFTSLEDWVSSRELFATGTSYSEFSDLSESGKVAITWTATGPLIPQGAKLIALEQQERIFLLVAYPASSEFSWILDNMLQDLE